MNSREQPDLSIVIVNYKSDAYVFDCIRSLQAVRQGFRSECIILDNSVEDTGTRSWDDLGDVRVITPERNLGYAGACNRGFNESTGRYILFLNADTAYHSGSLEGLIRWLDENPSVGLAGPRVLNLDGTRQFSCRSFPDWSTALCHRHSFLTQWFPNNRWTAKYLRTDLDGKPTKVDWASGCCLIARRDALGEIGGFDEDYFLFFEDVDLAYRLKSNWNCVFYPMLTFTHVLGASRAYLADEGDRMKHISARRYYSKHLIRHPLLLRAFNTAIGLRSYLNERF